MRMRPDTERRSRPFTTRTPQRPVTWPGRWRPKPPEPPVGPARSSGSTRCSRTRPSNGDPRRRPVTATVVHKTGELDSVTNDVALVLGGANGPYVVAICVDGPGSDAGF